MLKVLIMFSVLLFSNFAFSQACESNNFFDAEGWDTHRRQDFAEVSKSVLTYYEHNKQHFVADLDLMFYSADLGMTINFKSFDDVRTPVAEMFGDLVLVTLPTGELLELRWYVDKTKHIIYDHKIQECAAELIPDVENALF